jgi:rSAM/selenodomain-associated transferase 1
MNVLAMFARHWQPGAVKTRLAARWGDERASQIYLAFVRTLLARCATIGDERWLVFTPADARKAFEKLGVGEWRLKEQSTGDLGQRMASLFSEAFTCGARRCVLIGSDSPTLPEEYLTQAFELLGRVPVVLGPARDGGYCLIGARGGVPPVFEGIEWSTDRVLQQTIRRLQSAGVSFALLPEWYDIDTAEDLERLRQELRDVRTPELIELRQGLSGLS